VCAALTIVMALAASQGADAQRLPCVTVRPGENAAQVAARITGNAANAQESWFQIVDPRTSRFASKARYDRVPAGWRACIVDDPAIASALTPNGAPPGVAERLRFAVVQMVRLIRASDANVALCAVLLVSFILASHSIERYVSYRGFVMTAMRQFGERFIHEFERPLIQPDRPDPPLQSRLRFTPRLSRVEILLTPSIGHRYPNLTDHRKNVEYDVTRVVELLHDQPFVNGTPYMRGRWVVVPFQLKVGITQAGGK